MLKTLLVEVDTSKNSLDREIKGISNVHSYMYRVRVIKKIKLQDGYSLGTSYPSTTHFDSAKGERSISGCTQAN